MNSHITLHYRTGTMFSVSAIFSKKNYRDFAYLLGKFIGLPKQGFSIIFSAYAHYICLQVFSEVACI